MPLRSDTKFAVCNSLCNRFIVESAVISRQRILELTAQLLRTENPAVRDAVGAELHMAIDEYLNQNERDVLVLEFPRLAAG